MRATTKHETLVERIKTLDDAQLQRTRCEACHLVYVIERELFSRNGETPYEGQLVPNWGDKAFFFALVLVMGLMTWLSAGAWAL